MERQSTYDIARQNNFFMRVYGWMVLGLLVSAGMAWAIGNVPAVASLFLRFMVTTRGYGLWGLTILQIILVFSLRPNYEKLQSSTSYIIKYVLYAALTGITLYTYTLIFDFGSILQAFVTTAALFVGFSVVGLTTKKDLSGMGQQALGALLGIIVASAVNIFFFRSTAADLIVSGITVVIFLILTLYDTQKLKALYAWFDGEVPTSMAILGALELYLDFLNIFISLLRIFGKRNN